MSLILKEILFNKHKSIRDRLKNTVFYLSRKKGATKTWEIRHENVFGRNQNYNNPLQNRIEQDHANFWSDFRRKVDPATIRICSHISGKTDTRIVPEDIFVSEIEPSLKTDQSVDFLSNKSFYNRWFTKGLFPKDVLHNINGQYLDSNLNEIAFDDFKKKCSSITYPIVFKPNRDSYGGEGIHFIKESEQLIQIAKNRMNFVIQEQIEQHGFFKKYNPIGLNTFRVYLYRSVLDNRLHVLNTAFRMGQGGSLDNETAGGIHTRINEDGFMNGYAVDKFGTKYLEHPDTGLPFDKKIPDYEGLIELSLKIGEQVFLTRIIGLDACYDDNENWRAIEINTKGHTIRFSQYGGQPFFGNFTEEVISYCNKYHWALK